MQRKTTVRYYFSYIGMDCIKKKKQEITSAGKKMEKSELLCITGGNIKQSAAVEDSMAVPQKK